MPPVPDVKILPNPGGDWVRRLPDHSLVWLVKEHRVAQVLDHTVAQVGRVADTVRLYIFSGELGGGYWQTWYVLPDGRGFDGKPLFMPIEGHLPEPTEVERWRQFFGENMDTNALLDVAASRLRVPVPGPEPQPLRRRRTLELDE